MQDNEKQVRRRRPKDRGGKKIGGQISPTLASPDHSQGAKKEFLILLLSPKTKIFFCGCKLSNIEKLSFDFNKESGSAQLSHGNM